MSAVPAARNVQGRRMTVSAHCAQRSRERVGTSRRRTARRTAPPASQRNTRWPSAASSAGISVSATSTAMRTTEMVPTAKPVKIGMPTTSIPARATVTVSPLKKTARPAVPPVAAAASTGSRPARSSSRKRPTTSSE